MIRIENWHPCPPKQTGHCLGAPLQLDPSRPRPAAFRGLTKVLKRMEFGQSVFLRGVRSCAAQQMLRYAKGRKFTVRQGRRGTRVWFIGFVVSLNQQGGLNGTRENAGGQRALVGDRRGGSEQDPQASRGAPG